MIRASDLPVGTRVTTKDSTIYLRDRAGMQGWWRYPIGHYFDEEIDKLLQNGASISNPAATDEMGEQL